ncbi:MAG: translation initiation factor IF-2 subunit gamma [Nanohaloarchaea archaeon SW_7_43_1]|nr:MAG: translation initiation factor IF-2 subunit gamma [Nanohaloarchaea archaeon SW_7_43_1]
MTEEIPEVNIGLVGHVDHGKTTLTNALTGKWTDKHSEELKKGITIKLGYADVSYYQDEDGFNVDGKGEHVRTISLVDSPGHETLMANVLSGAAIMDGAILLVAADEEVPQPQTREHLAALDIIGIENIVVVQNKIDKVSKEESKENYRQIKEFLEGSVAEDAPIIPISAQQEVNIDALTKTVEEEIPTPERDTESEPKMLIARSFDINKPGTDINKIKGSVLGGSLVKGKLKEGEKIEIRPGVREDGKWNSVETEIETILHGGEPVEEGTPGGLLAVETSLDPALSKSDGLAGNVLGKKGEVPETTSKVKIDVELMEELVGSDEGEEIENIKKGEPLMINVGTGKSAGAVTGLGKTVEIDLKMPICAEEGDRVALSRQIGSRWRLIGHGKVTST